MWDCHGGVFIIIGLSFSFYVCVCVCDPGVQFHGRVFSLYIYQHSPHFTVVYGNSYLLLNVQ